MKIRKEAGEFQVVVFTLGENEFAIPIGVVREILNVAKLVALPNMPAAMVGIINVRGKVLPIVDLKTKFAMGNGLSRERAGQKILLVELESTMVGFLVDAVSEVLRVSQDALEYLETIQGAKGNLIDSICKVGDRLIPLVDSSKLLTDQETEQLEEVKERTICSEI